MTVFISYIFIFEHGFEHGFKYGFEHGFEHGIEHSFQHELISYSFYITSFFSRLVLDSILRSSFICVNVSNSNKISEYSSSEMESSDNAFEMRLLIVLSDETADIVIFSFFFYFQRHLFNRMISYNSK